MQVSSFDIAADAFSTFKVCKLMASVCLFFFEFEVERKTDEKDSERKEERK